MSADRGIVISGRFLSPFHSHPRLSLAFHEYPDIHASSYNKILCPGRPRSPLSPITSTRIRSSPRTIIHSSKNANWQWCADSSPLDLALIHINLGWAVSSFSAFIPRDRSRCSGPQGQHEVCSNNPAAATPTPRRHESDHHPYPFGFLSFSSLVVAAVHFTHYLEVFKNDPSAIGVVDARDLPTSPAQVVGLTYKTSTLRRRFHR